MEAVSLSVAEFRSVCRLCLRKENLIVFDELDPELLYFLRTILECDVTVDVTLPQNICAACVLKLQRFDGFIKRSQQVTKILHSIKRDSHNDSNENSEYIYIIDNVCDEFAENNTPWEQNAPKATQEGNNRDIKDVIISGNNIPLKVEFNSSGEIVEHYPKRNTSTPIKNNHSVLIQNEDEMKNNVYIDKINDFKDEYDPEQYMEFQSGFAETEKTIDSQMIETCFNTNDTVIDPLTERKANDKEQNEMSNKSKIDPAVVDLLNILGGSELDISPEHSVTKISDPTRFSENFKVCSIEIIGCSLCGDTFKHIEHLLKHYARFEKCNDQHLYCSVCAEDFKDQSSMKNHLRNNHEGIGLFYKCTECNKEFRYLYDVIVHEQQHITSFNCHICGLGFKDLQKLRNHSTQHVTEEKHICKICSEEFVGKRAFKQHYRKHTKGDKRLYRCKTCNEKFEQIAQLNEHTEEHRIKGELENIVCEVCSKTFTSKESFKWHKKIHEDLKKFACPNCNKRFRTRFHLTQHSYVHSNIKEFKCEICLTEFLHIRSYSRHMLIHKDGRRHFCEVCGKVFPDSYHLKAHSARHSKEKNYICTHCGWRCKTQRSCYKHEQTHTYQ